MTDMTYKTDKLTNGYGPTYRRLADEIGPAGHVLEIGVQRGGGLEMFLDFFPMGRVVGVDNDPDAVWPEHSERIVASQDDPGLSSLVGGPFDLIVDDASHDGKITATTLDFLFPLVKPGGYYVIEDWGVGFDSWKGYDDSMHKLAVRLLDHFTPGVKSDVESIEYSTGLIVMRKWS